jgi:hypothetical protein
MIPQHRSGKAGRKSTHYSITGSHAEQYYNYVVISKALEIVISEYYSITCSHIRKLQLVTSEHDSITGSHIRT